MIVAVSVPSRLSKLANIRLELSAAQPIADDFHADVAARAAAVTAVEFAKSEASENDPSAPKGDPKVIIKAHAAEADASRIAESVAKSLRRVENTIDGYKLVTSQSVDTFADAMSEDERKTFANFARRLREARLDEGKTAKQRRTEIENIRTEMMRAAREVGLPLHEILSA